MNKITLKIGKNGTYKNISELIQKVSVTGRRGDAPRTLSATLFDSEQFVRASANLPIFFSREELTKLPFLAFFEVTNVSLVLVL